MRITRIFLLLTFSTCLLGMSPAVVRPPLEFNFGLSERQGRRPEMEDRFSVAKNIDSDSQHVFFALYDGHNGVQAANVLAEYLPIFYVAAFHAHGSVPAALRAAFNELDKLILAQFERSGSTAVVAAIYHGDLYLAWAGDSRGILVIPSTLSNWSTKDHDPSNPAEVERVEDAGGFFAPDRYGIVRTNGQILPTRGFGDRYVKEMNSAYIVEPEIIGPLRLAKNDIIILACDGVSEAFKGQEGQDVAIQFVLRTIFIKPEEFEVIKERNSAQPMSEIITEEYSDERLLVAARRLRDAAYRIKSGDNISVMVISVGERVPLQAEPLQTE